MSSQESLNTAEDDVKTAQQDLDSSDEAMNQAQEELVRETAEHVATQGKLLALLQEVEHLRYEEARHSHARGGDKLSKVQLQLKEREKHDEKGCEALRVKVVHARGKLEAAKESLETCLSTKKLIRKD